jgi:hypothetical protein
VHAGSAVEYPQDSFKVCPNFSHVPPKSHTPSASLINRPTLIYHQVNQSNSSDERAGGGVLQSIWRTDGRWCRSDLRVNAWQFNVLGYSTYAHTQPQKCTLVNTQTPFAHIYAFMCYPPEFTPDFFMLFADISALLLLPHHHLEIPLFLSGVWPCLAALPWHVSMFASGEST